MAAMPVLLLALGACAKQGDMAADAGATAAEAAIASPEGAFLAYEHDTPPEPPAGEQVSLRVLPPHSTTVYKVQEAFNNVTLPDENVYRDAIVAALGGRK